MHTTKSKHVNKIIIHSAALCNQVGRGAITLFSKGLSGISRICTPTNSVGYIILVLKRNECMMMVEDCFEMRQFLNAQHSIVVICCDLGGGFGSQSFGLRHDLRDISNHVKATS